MVAHWPRRQPKQVKGPESLVLLNGVKVGMEEGRRTKLQEHAVSS